MTEEKMVDKSAAFSNELAEELCKIDDVQECMVERMNDQVHQATEARLDNPITVDLQQNYVTISNQLQQSRKDIYKMVLSQL